MDQITLDELPWSSTHRRESSSRRTIACMTRGTATSSDRTCITAFWARRIVKVPPRSTTTTSRSMAALQTDVGLPCRPPERRADARKGGGSGRTPSADAMDSLAPWDGSMTADLERPPPLPVWCSAGRSSSARADARDEFFRRYHAGENGECGALPEMLVGEIADGLLGEALDDAVAELRATSPRTRTIGAGSFTGSRRAPAAGSPGSSRSSSRSRRGRRRRPDRAADGVDARDGYPASGASLAASRYDLADSRPQRGVLPDRHYGNPASPILERPGGAVARRGDPPAALHRGGRLS